MMSGEDLRRLDARSRRRGWLAGAAKALARVTAAAALAAAGVVTVRAVRGPGRAGGVRWPEPLLSLPLACRPGPLW
jgi:hypothetical protein